MINTVSNVERTTSRAESRDANHYATESPLILSLTRFRCDSSLFEEDGWHLSHSDDLIVIFLLVKKLDHQVHLLMTR